MLLVSAAIALVHAGPSLRALSTPFTSVVVLAVVSAVTTTIAGVALTTGYYAERAIRTGWTHATVFPAIWATGWAAVEYCSPIGQLTTWSPVVQLGGYAWLRQYGGQVAINWVVAAWAVVLADAAGAWIMGSDGEKDAVVENPSTVLISFDDAPVENTTRPAVHSTKKARPTLLLASLLLALAAPSYIVSTMPPPVSAPDVTPFGVACALPYPQRNGQLTHSPTLDDYFQESKRLQNEAKIVLWPETAVRFDSVDDRTKAFEKMRPQISNGTYFAIGFEETIHADSPDGVWKVGMRRNGLVLLGWEGVVYEYYKRHLVPSKSWWFVIHGYSHLTRSSSRRVVLNDAGQ